MKRRVGFMLVAMGIIYLLVVGCVYALMLQPPEHFAAGIAKMPEPFFLLVPFRQLWIRARAGHLNVGDPAPDFRLETLDRKSRVQLSSFRGQKPVVLVFGSYT